MVITIPLTPLSEALKGDIRQLEDANLGLIIGVIPIFGVAIFTAIVIMLRKKTIDTLREKIRKYIGLDEYKYVEPVYREVYLNNEREVDEYTLEKFAKDCADSLPRIKTEIKNRLQYADKINSFLSSDHPYKADALYRYIFSELQRNVFNATHYYVVPKYISPNGKITSERNILLTEGDIDRLIFNLNKV